MRSASHSKESLEPDSRHDLLKLISSEKPFKAGLILSYSVDVAPLYAVLLNLASGSTELESATEALTVDPSAILRSLQSLEDKLKIVVHAGGFRPGNQAELLQGMLDSLIKEFLPMHAGEQERKVSFHPKVYLFQFGDETSSEIRLIVTSKNLSLDTSLDVFSAFEVKTLSKGKEPSNLHQFLYHAITHAGAKPPEKVLKLVESVKFHTLKPYRGMGESLFRNPTFYGQIGGTADSLNPPKLSQLAVKHSEDSLKKRIVVSPFLTVAALETFFPQGVKKENTYLLSRPEELNKIYSRKSGKTVLDRVNCYVMGSHGEEGMKGLHAKLYLDKYTDFARISVGSANCSNRAWDGHNWEAMIHSDVPLEVFDQMVVDFFLGTTDGKRSPITEEYFPEPIEEDEKKRISDLWCNALSAATLRATAKRTKEDKKIILVDLNVGFISPDNTILFELKASPLGMVQRQTYIATKEDEEFHVYWKVPVGEFSCFVELEIVVDTVSFLVTRRMEVDNEEELFKDRGQKALAHIVCPDGPLKYLDQILGGSFGKAKPTTKGNGEGDGEWSRGLGFANLEKLYLACIHEKHLLPEIDRLLSLNPGDFPDDESGQRARRAIELLGPIWQNLKTEYYHE